MADKIVMNREIGEGVFSGIVMVFVSVLAVFYLKFHWDRRRIYKLSAKAPGPRGFPFIGHAHKLLGDSSAMLRSILETWEEYGDLIKVWYGPKLVYGVSKPEDIEIVVNNIVQRDTLIDFMRPLLGNGIFTARVNKWKKHRKIISPAFNPRALEGFVEIFAEKSNILVKVLEKNVDNADVDLSKILANFSMDTLFESTMGTNLNAQEKAVSAYGHYVETAFMIASMRMYKLWLQVDFIFRWSKFNTLLNDIIPKAQKLTEQVITERKKTYEEQMKLKQSGNEFDSDETKRKSFMDLLLGMSYNGEKFTDREIKDEVDTIAAAGTDTTATALGFSFIVLGMFPEIERKIYEEVTSVMGEERDMEAKDLQQLKYLERFIKECLRLFPVGPLLLRKAEKDVDIGSTTIPCGTTVIVGILRVHRNPNYWPDPFKFDPDRFLPEEIAKRHPYSYLPFAAGPRNCIGHKYAMNAMKTVLAHVIRKFRFSTEYKSLEEVELVAHVVLKPAQGYKVKIHHRD